MLVSTRAASLAVPFVLIALAAAAPLPRRAGDFAAADRSAVDLSAVASRAVAAVANAGRRLATVARSVIRKQPAQGELETSARYASGSFWQEMTYGRLDNPGMATGLFTYADGWANGQPFNNGWSKWNHHFQNDALVLDLKKQWFNDPGSKTGNGRSYPYTSAEFRTHDFFGAGCYSVCMKPARDSGVSTSFYTLSGEYDAPPHFHESNPLHNEIDVEFVGKNTRGFQSNYFSRYHDKNANSGSGNEQWHDLDFDTAAGFHKYSFKWTPKGIVWWVDGHQVRSVGVGDGVPSPNYSPARVVGNIWPVNEQAEEWAGSVDPAMTYSNAKYKWIQYEAGESCGPSPKRCGLH